MSSPVSTPRCGAPLTSITSWVRQNLSIASATKPCDQALRARSISLAAAAGALGFLQDAGVGLGKRHVGEERAGLRHFAARQIDGGRSRPVLAEQLLDGLDGGAGALDQRIAVARIGIAGSSTSRSAQSAVVAQEHHPGLEGAGTQAASRPVPGTMSRPSLL